MESVGFWAFKITILRAWTICVIVCVTSILATSFALGAFDSPAPRVNVVSIGVESTSNWTATYSSDRAQYTWNGNGSSMLNLTRPSDVIGEWSVSLSARNLNETGVLHIVIWTGEKVLAEKSTTAPFGFVQIAAGLGPN
ncbi:MAG TPA: hypothetical protein VEH08_02495 [Methanomassiliicoccales archaeon]|nr:hypothetical protein [Methanomassiliicoccales archaeon]